MREPSAVIHNDYTEWSANKRFREVLGNDQVVIDRYSGQYSRFAIVNVWRPLSKVVQNYPLALCDSTTLSVERDIVSVPRVSKDGRKGEIQMAHYHPDHQWYYFPGMTSQDILLIKTYDSKTTVNRYTIHTSIKLPEVDESITRESIESRSLLFFK